MLTPKRNFHWAFDLGIKVLMQGSVISQAYTPLGQMQAFEAGVLGTTAGATRFNLIQPATTSQTWANSAQGVYARSDIKPGAQQTVLQGVMTAAEVQTDVRGLNESTNQYPSQVISMEYDAWGNLVEEETWSQTYHSSPGAPVAQLPSGAMEKYTYDALGRRVTEAGSGGADAFYYDASGNVIEEDAKGKTQAQYVWSPVPGVGGVNMLILRDSIASGTSGGNVGMTNSGLNLRLYALQNAQGDVTALVEPNGSQPGIVVERYTYTPQGDVTAMTPTMSGPATTDYGFRYLYRASRSDGNGFTYLSGVEHNALTNSGLTEDPEAYQDMHNAYELSVIQNSDFEQPTWIKWTSRGLGLAGAALITLGTGGLGTAAWYSVIGMTTGAAAGAYIGGTIAQQNGGSFSRGAEIGFDVGSLVGSFGPQLIETGLARWEAQGAVIGNGLLRSSIPQEVPELAEGVELQEQLQNLPSAGGGFTPGLGQFLGATPAGMDAVFSVGNGANYGARGAIEEGMMEADRLTEVTPGKAGLPNNMWGPPGDPVHQATVDRLEVLAADEFPGMNIHREEMLPEDLGISRAADVWAEDPVTGDVIKVYEAARYENGSLVSRELLKLKQYEAAGIDYHFEEVR